MFDVFCEVCVNTDAKIKVVGFQLKKSLISFWESGGGWSRKGFILTICKSGKLETAGRCILSLESAEMLQGGDDRGAYWSTDFGVVRLIA